jgi:predicted ArsR family transcriptional regulator
MTLDQLAAELGLTRTAVRMHLSALERDGHVARRGLQPGRTKPAQVYELTDAAEHELSSAYMPLFRQLMNVLADRLATTELDSIMRQAGRALASEHARPRGSLRERVYAASDLLNEFGGLTTVEEGASKFVIRSHGCPVAAAAARHPETCRALESLVSFFVDGPVRQCCDRVPRPRCCFEVYPPAHRRPMKT